MTRRKPSPPSSYLATPPPETSPRSSTSAAASDWDADDEETMSTGGLTISRPPSAAGSHADQHSIGPYAPTRPTLPDVLSNSAPPPWTLSAFTAYLSQNHCLENLEFTMDADRYRERFDAMRAQMAGMPISPDYEECNYLRLLWQRLLDAYIIPDGTREINIPSSVRETLLSLPNDTVPPRPEELDDATKIIYNLMEESVLVSFLNDIPTASAPKPHGEQTMAMDIDSPSRQSSTRRKHNRSRSRRRPSPSSSTDMFSFNSSTSRRAPSQTTSLTVNPTRTHRSASHLSSGSADASLTDDSASASSRGREPMTPPTTPPSSDIGGTSPKHRSDNAWKKMMVWKKKSSNGIRDGRFGRVDE